MVDIRTDEAVKLRRLGKLIDTAATMIETLDVSEARVVQLKQSAAELGQLNKNLEAQLEENKAALVVVQKEAQETKDSAKITSDGVLVAAKEEAEKILGDAKKILEDATAKAKAITEEAVLLRESAKEAAARKAKELLDIETKIDKLKAAAKTFAGV